MAGTLNMTLVSSSSPKKNCYGENISINLRKLMLLANISEHELSRRTKIKQPIIHRLLSGTNTNPKLATLKPLADYFTVSLSQLVGDEEISSVWSGFTSKEHHGWRQIPLISYEQIHDNNKKQTATKFVIVDCNVSDETYALVINDQSTEPIFPKNSFVIIDPHVTPLHGDYVILTRIDSETTIWQLLLNKKQKYANPVNRKFNEIITLSKQDIILGTIIRTIYDHRNITGKEI